MQEDQQYLVPDYYPDFRCKQGACRTPCCEGWPISVTMQDYFNLLSVPCSAELRRRLDGALHLHDHPTPEQYAQISPRYDGVCPLHMPDGRCQLHAELGEEMLSAVCRLYPRGVRTGEFREASCANSCEAVVEMLLERDAPMRFIPRPVQHCLPDAPPRRHPFHTGGREQEIRLWLIRQLQARDIPLPRRMLRLGHALQAMDEALAARDDVRVDALLSGREALPAPLTPAAGHDQLLSGREALPAPLLPAAGHDHLLSGLETAEKLMDIIDGRSRSVHDYGEAALAYFGQGETAYACYQAAAEQFARIVPGWETWLEQLLVNHMFFSQFPFQDRPVPLRDEYFALCAVYVLLRFLLIGWTAEHPTREAAVDVAAAAFRLIAHTDFDCVAAPIMRRIGCDDWQHLQQLLGL